MVHASSIHAHLGGIRLRILTNCFPMCSQWPKVLNASLAEVDPELVDIIEREKNRQYKVKGEQRWDGLP